MPLDERASSERCNICRRSLDNPDDPVSLNCGGDCLYCMATVAEDPDCIAHLQKIFGEAENPVH